MQLLFVVMGLITKRFRVQIQFGYISSFIITTICYRVFRRAIALSISFIKLTQPYVGPLENCDAAPTGGGDEPLCAM